MKYFSMFSGIGGFEIALKDNHCVGYSEIDKHAINIYEKHFSNTNYGDATKIDAKKLPDFDLLVGGFPCQAFSVAGKRRGFEDTRGTLFFDIARILKEKKPKYILLENVKGLLSHDNGRTFQTILGVLADIGYRVQWQVLNSKDFGVPQNRERIFIIGHIRGQSRPKVFPITRENKKTIKSGQVVGTLQAGYAKGDRTGGYVIEEKKIIEDFYPDRIRTYSKTCPTLRSDRVGLKILQLNKPKHSNDRVYSDKGISPTLNTMQGGDRQPIVAVLTPDRENKRQNGRRFKKDGEPSFTLTGQDEHGVYDGLRIRKLTPLECERLQGFPDNWTQGISDTQRYKCIGNAVTVNVVRYIVALLEDK